ncbi:MAG: hydroxyethylthiazole kinase [Lachnospirales bacterium]
MFYEILENVRRKSPLIHCMTNYVTVNDCANIISAIGGSSVMSDEILEVEDVVAFCDGLLVNIGTLNERTIKAMRVTMNKANLLHKPIVFDPVGAGATKYRNDVSIDFVTNNKQTVIKGNATEIKALHGDLNEERENRGIDANVFDTVTKGNMKTYAKIAMELSEQTGAVIVITGSIDIVASEDDAYFLFNGSNEMGEVVGTGCQLGAMIATFVSADKENIFNATAAAVCLYGIAGSNVNYDIDGKCDLMSLKTDLCNNLYNFEREFYESNYNFKTYRQIVALRE